MATRTDDRNVIRTEERSAVRGYDRGLLTDGPTAPIVQWSAVVSGAVIGLAILAMLGALWVALAEGTGVDHIAVNLHWYAMGSALVSLFLAGVIAGWIAGVRGIAQGMMNGLSVWGLLLVAALAIGTPGALQVIDLGQPLEELTTEVEEGVEGIGTDQLWATFLALAGGLAIAGIGGIAGGTMPRPAPHPSTGDPLGRRTASATRYTEDPSYRSTSMPGGSSAGGYSTVESEGHAYESDYTPGDGDGERRRGRGDRRETPGRRAEDWSNGGGTTQVIARDQRTTNDRFSDPDIDVRDRPQQ